MKNRKQMIRVVSTKEVDEERYATKGELTPSLLPAQEEMVPFQFLANLHKNLQFFQEAITKL